MADSKYGAHWLRTATEDQMQIILNHFKKYGELRNRLNNISDGELLNLILKNEISPAHIIGYTRWKIKTFYNYFDFPPEIILEIILELISTWPDIKE